MRDVGAAGMDHVDNHLSAVKKAIGEDLTGADGD